MKIRDWFSTVILLAWAVLMAVFLVLMLVHMASAFLVNMGVL